VKIRFVAAVGDPAFFTGAILLQEKSHPTFARRAFYGLMNKNDDNSRRRRVMDDAAAAIEKMELYCAAHPESPSAVRRPKLSSRSDLWIALLGPSMEEGIVGIGPTVEEALRAFDAQYLATQPPPNDRASLPRKPH
jgi:hypothetical protein